MPNIHVEVAARDLRGIAGPLPHRDICHGETAPTSRMARLEGAPDRVRFHVAISPMGDALYLFREGYVPQAIIVAELVSGWLLANGHDTSERRPNDQPITESLPEPAGSSPAVDQG